MEQRDLFGEIVLTDVLLRDRFMEPPFSVLDTKSGSWQNRKRQWIAKGIKSEKGRKENLLNFSKTILLKNESSNGTSIFDPALTELMYRWFAPEEGTILDPFAGGSVRGIVANYLKYKYTGIDLRQEQVDSNRDQALQILEVNNQPQWYCGDSDKVLDSFGSGILKDFDMIFSCPPYGDLEVYSDHEDDLSNMDYAEFVPKYRSIIRKAVNLLKPGSFAVFVVGDIRDKHGFYRDFLGDTKRAFIDSGAKLYNEMILLNSVGTACMRAPKIFGATKKVVKIHQNVLVFKKIK
jgi:DNA modification methylase